MKSEKRITLSIETAIEGGSISIIDGTEEVDFWIGAKDSLKAEEFLVEISKILKKNKIDKKHIKLVTVSNGPGSSTGIKIGLATARGIGTALNCEVVEISLLEAILKSLNINGNSKALVILPVGRNLFFLEKVGFVNFNYFNGFGKIGVFTFEELIEELNSFLNSQIIIHRKTFEIYNNLVSKYVETKNQLLIFEGNMASVIAKHILFADASDNNVQN
jgi:tRNA threonylcarbamoyl adenosine modification protein YeaZ